MSSYVYTAASYISAIPYSTFKQFFYGVKYIYYYNTPPAIQEIELLLPKSKKELLTTVEPTGTITSGEETIKVQIVPVIHKTGPLGIISTSDSLFFLLGLMIEYPFISIFLFSHMLPYRIWYSLLSYCPRILPFLLKIK